MAVAAASPAKDLPPEAAYVRVQDGQLKLQGERLRVWGVIGKVFLTPDLESGDSAEQKAAKIAEARRGTDRLLDRFQELGFNGVRLREAVPNTEEYVIGDGSAADAVDYFLAEAGKRGFKIWAWSTNRVGRVSAAEVEIVKDASTSEAWAEAVGSGMELRNNPARIWDARLEALGLERMKAIVTHTNKHTGLRWGDDPIFAVWELSNEEWWMRKMLAGSWKKLPVFFQQQLEHRWNAWLTAKYKDEKGLLEAWGALMPDEILEKGNLKLAPLGKKDPKAALNDANEEARQAVAGVPGPEDSVELPEARASDVLEFLLELQLAHKKRSVAAFKTWGQSTRLCTVLFDTGIGYETHSQFMHQQAEAVSHDAYVNGWGMAPGETEEAGELPGHLHRLELLSRERRVANTGPWINWLLLPPGIAQGVPWLEHNKVEGKPFLVYETQIQQPAKYRADFPLRIAALGSIQDWDWISWHYFTAPSDVGRNEKAFDKAMDITTGKHPQGYHYTYDEVQGAMMRAAGMMFRQQAFAPAKNPTTFIYGRMSLFSPESMVFHGSYGKTGHDMMPTTYQYGVRIRIDPEREEDEVIGPVVRFEDRWQHNPYQPTDEILFDWKKGFLKLDSPDAVAFTGLLARYGEEVRFGNGAVLKNVKIVNPPAIFSPISDEELYVAFALFSRDGKSLAESKSLSVSLVSSSFNTGFQMSEKGAPPFHKPPPGTKAGTWPVLVARVGGVLEWKALDGMSYTLHDWHFKVIGSGIVSDGRLKIPENLPVFSIELKR